MSEITSLESETHINLLPEELLCMIFDLLDLTNVKIASLTCRRWHGIIFCSAYANRFKLQINSRINELLLTPSLVTCNFKMGPCGCNPARPLGHRDKNELDIMGQSFIKDVADAMNHTKRRYRNVRIHLDTYVIDHFSSLWQSLHPNVTEHIYSLELDFLHAVTAFPALIEGIVLMPHLRSLSLYNTHFKTVKCTLRSSSVQHLRIFCGYGIPFDIPELQSFEGRLCSLKQPDAIAHPLLLPKLKHVKLHSHNEIMCSESWQSIRRRLVAVETLEVRGIVRGNDFLTLRDAFTSLKKLYLQSVLNETDLTLLRQLKCRNARSVPFHCDVDFSQHTQLEDLDLGGNVFWDATSVVCLPQSIRFLSVPIRSDNEDNVMKQIIGSLKHLQKLRLNYPNFKSTPVAKRTMNSLRYLKQLKELEFVHAKFAEQAFLDMETPVHQLRTLRFVRCRLEHKHVQSNVQVKFPNLKHCVYTVVDIRLAEVCFLHFFQ
ncbi:uncharacterized protein LOC118463850 [Anopheles albimanus]|uniref:uncharacterized protein LOC118463850 n=1 Tax=Anopheles albimanus TaxID=7167 RepID=UPI00164035DF|nr:uncharacterized protein LOC118463850 [Anopheles albimanus]